MFAIIGWIFIIGGLSLLFAAPGQSELETIRSSILGAALFVGGAVFLIGAQIDSTIQKPKNSSDKKKQPAKGRGHGSV